MKSVSISPKYQVVIPLEIREMLNLQPGEKLIVMAYQNRIEYVLQRKIKKLKGILPGLDTNVDRERKDRA